MAGSGSYTGLEDNEESGNHRISEGRQFGLALSKQGCFTYLGVFIYIRTLFWKHVNKSKLCFVLKIR